VEVTDPAELYGRYSADVFRFALYLSGNHAEAEDLTSETFVRAWTAPEAIRSATVKGYLFTIARNLHLQAWRRRRREVELDVTIEATLRDPAAGPETEAERHAELDAVLRALQSLEEIDRAAILMRAMDDMPYDEIARSLGISVPAARVKVHRARRALMEAKQ
jgi:RNA polymerase sigma-70 factor (ECF subfamily)